MTDGIDIKVTGLKELNKSLYRYSQQLGDKVVIDSLKAGAKLVQKGAKNRAPRRTGLLRRSIVVRKSKRYSKRRTPGKLGVYLTINKKKAFYGRFQESGWKSRGGKRVKGREFINRAFQARRVQAVNLIINTLRRGEAIVRRKTRLR